MKKYDDATWHTEGDYPPGLPEECGATHIGMFLAWAINRSQVSERLKRESLEAVSAVRRRELSGRDFVLHECDGKLLSEDLSSSGKSFAESYYASEYYGDYVSLFPEAASLYHVPDSWETYARVESVLDRRFMEWSRL